MDSGVAEDSLALLLQRHAELEDKYGDGDGGRFLSGWQCQNPWAEHIGVLVRQESDQFAGGDYLYLDSDPVVTRGLTWFHEKVDHVAPESLLYGSGASTIIFTFCAWLRQRKVREVFYIPPLYFSTHFALRLFGIRARPISGRHAIEPGFLFNLPSQTAIMLLADPVWYAGVPLPLQLIQALVEWQQRTQSLVFVDGSFQYARWDGRQEESTALLDPKRTVRLICPTKALAMHGYRFAYAILPNAMHTECKHIYANLYGSMSVENAAFARVAPTIMAQGEITHSLMTLASERHQLLRASGKISALWQPLCGYFVFEKITAQLPVDTLLMDGSFFEQKHYPDYRRINLLSPSMHLFD